LKEQRKLFEAALPPEELWQINKKFVPCRRKSKQTKEKK
jgi:hypothetical protein